MILLERAETTQVKINGPLTKPLKEEVGFGIPNNQNQQMTETNKPTNALECHQQIFMIRQPAVIDFHICWQKAAAAQLVVS